MPGVEHDPNAPIAPPGEANEATQRVPATSRAAGPEKPGHHTPDCAAEAMTVNGHEYALRSEATGWGDVRVWVERDGVVAWERFETVTDV